MHRHEENVHGGHELRAKKDAANVSAKVRQTKAYFIIPFIFVILTTNGSLVWPIWVHIHMGIYECRLLRKDKKSGCKLSTDNLHIQQCRG